MDTIPRTSQRPWRGLWNWLAPVPVFPFFLLIYLLAHSLCVIYGSYVHDEGYYLYSARREGMEIRLTAAE